MIQNEKYEEAIELLNKSKQWPENLGVGKPFKPDERIADYLIGFANSKLNNEKEAETYWQTCANFTKDHLQQASLNHILGLQSIAKLDGQEEARSTMKALLDSVHGKSPNIQWIATYFNQTKETLAQEDMKSGLVESDSHKLLLAILNL